MEVVYQAMKMQAKKLPSSIPYSQRHHGRPVDTWDRQRLFWPNLHQSINELMKSINQINDCLIRIYRTRTSDADHASVRQD